VVIWGGEDSDYERVKGLRAGSCGRLIYYICFDKFLW